MRSTAIIGPWPWLTRSHYSISSVGYEPSRFSFLAADSGEEKGQRTFYDRGSDQRPRRNPESPSRMCVEDNSHSTEHRQKFLPMPKEVPSCPNVPFSLERECFSDTLRAGWLNWREFLHEQSNNINFPHYSPRVLSPSIRQSLFYSLWHLSYIRGTSCAIEGKHTNFDVPLALSIFGMYMGSQALSRPT